MQFSTTSALLLAGILAFASPAGGADNHQHQHAGQASHATQDHEEHNHAAPHGGALIVLGDEHAAHLELVHEPTTGKLTGYVLDGEAEKALRVSQPEIKLSLSGGDLKSSASVALKAVSSPLTGEKAGDTSQFEATVPALTGVKRFEIVVESLNVRGAEYKNTKATYPDGNH